MLTVPLITAHTCIVTIETSSIRVLHEYCTITLRRGSCKLKGTGGDWMGDLVEQPCLKQPRHQKSHLHFFLLFLRKLLTFLEGVSKQTFQRCFNVVFWLMRRRDVGQHQINVETTLRISTLKFTTSNNVESTLCISTLTWTTLDNVETTLSFSTSSVTTLVNVETTLWKWPLLKRTKKN